MKSSKLPAFERRKRRELIMEKRGNMILQHSRSYVQYRTTKFDKHSSESQRARYARQLASGQIKLVAAAVAATKTAGKVAKRTTRSRKTGA